MSQYVTFCVHLLDMSHFVCYYLSMTNNTNSTYPISPSCDNCRYFIRYYIKHHHKFSPRRRGFCFHSRTKEIKNSDRTSGCNQWEPSEDLPDNQIRSVKEILERIDKSLKALAETLTDEELLS